MVKDTKINGRDQAGKIEFRKRNTDRASRRFLCASEKSRRIWAQNITRLDEELVICDFQKCSYYEIVGTGIKELFERGTLKQHSRMKQKTMQLVKEIQKITEW